MQTLSNGMTLLDAFPFDSSPNLVYTNQGYPRGDRAVDAWTMRHAFRQFFSTGVFGTPANAFEISKGTGLTVTIQPGMCVIEGGMGGISEKSGPLTLTLGTGPAQGKTPYGIMLRYDDNSDVRGITVYAKKGTPGDNPTPPEPDTESANVHELRLGYVVVPNGASDLSEASITNEKGLAVCPYAAPFAEIDMSQVTADAKATAIAALDSLMAYFEQYREMIDSAIDGTLAGQLQEQINQLKEQLDNFDLSTSVDNKTIEYTQDFGQLTKVLSVMDGGITTAKLASGAAAGNISAGEITSTMLAEGAAAENLGTGSITTDMLEDGAVTAEKLDDYVAAMIGEVDVSGWNYNQILDFCTGRDSKEQKYVVQNAVTAGKITSWGFTKLAALLEILQPDVQYYLVKTTSKLSSAIIDTATHEDAKAVVSATVTDAQKEFLGRYIARKRANAKHVTIAEAIELGDLCDKTGIGGLVCTSTILTYSFTFANGKEGRADVVGAMADKTEDGKLTKLTWAIRYSLSSAKFNNTQNKNVTWATSQLRNSLESIAKASLGDIADQAVPVVKKYRASPIVDSNEQGFGTVVDKFWIASLSEYGKSTNDYTDEGATYEAFTSTGVTMYDQEGERTTSWTRTRTTGYSVYFNSYGGLNSVIDMTSSVPVHVFFCTGIFD